MNQREILFRMWRYCHGENKFKFYYLAPARVGVDDNDLVFSRVYQTGINDYCDTPLRTLNSEKDLNKVIIQQFTGLHDKNGKGVWEGDLVRINISHSQGSENTKSVYEVRLDVVYGISYFRVIKEGQHKGMEIHNRDQNFDGGIYYTPIEVVGNLLENPELVN